MSVLLIAVFIFMYLLGSKDMALVALLLAIVAFVYVAAVISERKYPSQ